MTSVLERRQEARDGLLETLPPRLPWVLLCHRSGASCGRVWTVQRLRDWRPTLEAVMAHEELCTVSPRGSLIVAR